MSVYATVEDVQAHLTRDLSADERNVCTALLEDAAAMIDALATHAPPDVRKIVSCRMVIRALGDGSSLGVPIGATQGSMSGLGYSQSWTVGGGSVGEMYIGKADRQLLGLSNAIGSRSPLECLPPPEVPRCGV